MPTNQFDDNQSLWAAELNAISDALGTGGIVSGCSISKGTGDWDIDVTSGTIIESNDSASISSDTVTITDASGLSSGESRVTLIHADTGDSIASTDGSAAADPASPDIPSGEVLLGFVVVANGDSTVADSDIIDIPALINQWSNEDGSFGVGGNNNSTESVSFSKTYDPDQIVWGISWDHGTTGTSESMWATWSAWSTDGNGDITGMDIEWGTSGLGAASPTVRWNVMGVVVP